MGELDNYVIAPNIPEWDCKNGKCPWALCNNNFISIRDEESARRIFYTH